MMVVFFLCLIVSTFTGCIQVDQPATKKSEVIMENKKVTTESGLSYEILTAGKEGQKPKKGDVVVVHYTGWLADKDGNPVMDKKFDSSVDRKQPLEIMIGVGQVIRGWDEGVMDMVVGEKRRLTIPAGLGYGAISKGSIPANSTLVFDVELLEIKKK